MTNLYEPEWDAERDAEPFRWKRARLGRQTGARDLGASLFEVPPGAEAVVPPGYVRMDWHEWTGE